MAESGMVSPFQDPSETPKPGLDYRGQTLFAQAVAELSMPVYLINPKNYQIVWGNNTSGFALGQIQKCYHLTHHRDAPCSEEDGNPCALELVKNRGKAAMVEHTHYDAYGRPRHEEVHAQPVFDDKGHLVLVTEFMVDTTRRKHLERRLVVANEELEKRVEERTRELQEKAERLEKEIARSKEYQAELELAHDSARQYFETARVMNLVFDLQGRIQDINSRGCEVLGLPREEVLGLDWFTNFLPEEIRLQVEDVFRHIVQSDPVSFEYECNDIVTGNGERRLVYFRNSPLYDRQGKLTGILSSGEDITEHRRAEELRIARQAAEEANQAKSEFLAKLSHEIRNPVSVIQGFSQILRRDPTVNERHHQYLQNIEECSGHLMSLVNDVLEISRLETGRLTLQNCDFNLWELLRQIENMFHSDVLHKNLWLRWENDASVPQLAHGDGTKLRQIFSNLLHNALKFTEKGGVSVRVWCEELDTKLVSEDYLKLRAEVADTGPGVAPGEVDLIFKEFAQSAVGKERGGSGLGLAITRQLVQLMGGEIHVESEPGEGSVFRFEVLVQPARQAHYQQTTQEKGTMRLAPHSQPTRVLAVDDRKDNRLMLRALLEEAGFDILEAEDGQQALETWEHFCPHLVVLDLDMPRVDGLEAARRIRKMMNGHKTAIIMVSGVTLLEEQERAAIESITDAYLYKPFRPHELLQTLSRFVDMEVVPRE